MRLSESLAAVGNHEALDSIFASDVSVVVLSKRNKVLILPDEAGAIRISNNVD